MKLVLPMLLAAAAVVRGEDMRVDSLELLADVCRDAGVYVVVEARKIDVLRDSYEVSLSLVLALKGEPQDHVVGERYSPRNWVRAPGPSILPGDQLLVCFERHDRQRHASQLVNLSNPALQSSMFIAVDSELHLLKDREAILTVFRRRLGKSPSGAHKPVMMEIEDPHSEVYQALYRGSACEVAIPADLVAEQAKRKQANNFPQPAAPSSRG